MKHRILAMALSASILGLSAVLPPAAAHAQEGMGDVNGDGVFDVSDVILFQKWLLGGADAALADWAAADFLADGRLNAADLCLMKQALIESGNDPAYQMILWRTDQIRSGFSAGVTATALWSEERTDAAAVITSVEELNEYLSGYFDTATAAQYAAQYNADYFRHYILLLNTLYQPSGTEPMLSISGVTFDNGTVHVTASWTMPSYTQDGESALLAQVTLPTAYRDDAVVWDITEENAPVIVDPPVPAPSEKRIEVTNILQNPELPTGCESVSLTILLNHLGYSVDKLAIARNYLPKMDFFWSGGVYYGADFRTTFAGDPESAHAYGCYAPCITTTANNYFTDKGYSSRAHNITGADFDSLLTDYIDQDMPVLIWITSANLHETKLTTIWTTPTGEKVQWVAYEHCVVLTGYDRDKDLIYVSDPLVGNTSYDYSRIRQRYIDLGQQAVYIQK